MTQFAMYAISIISMLGTFGWDVFREGQFSVSSLHAIYNTTNRNVEKPSAILLAQDELEKDNILFEPIAEFKSRITKKPFGIFITPETSPVAHDKFRGFHTGVDIEYDDSAEEVPVVAISDGKIILSRFAAGYGGVVVILHDIRNEEVLTLYGHLEPKSMVSVGVSVKRGQVIGYLGDHKSEETDGARKHLHFAMLKKNALDIRGYVKTLEELENWHNPLEFFTTGERKY